MIGDPSWIAPYWAFLDTLDEQLQILNTLCLANVVAVAEIEIAQSHTELLAQQEELREKEETWSSEIAEL